MTRRPIIDAGPGLNFLSINKERLLFGTLGPLSAPESVEQELLRKAGSEDRFHAAARVWRKLPSRWMEVLSDDQTPELNAVVHRMTSLPLQERARRRRDLGETMVIAHAVVAAEAGDDVAILIDDGGGVQAAAAEVRRLRRLRASGVAVGTVRLVNTLTVLERAAGGQHLPGRSEMRDVYSRLRRLDDGLPPIERTDLLSPDLWR